MLQRLKDRCLSWSHIHPNLGPDPPHHPQMSNLTLNVSGPFLSLRRWDTSRHTSRHITALKPSPHTQKGLGITLGNVATSHVG